MKKTMNHAAYQRSLRSKSEAELYFIMKDASEAAACGGVNSGYYMDEVHYAGMELNDRVADRMARARR